MKSLREFLIESAKQYNFKIKIASEITDEQLEKLEAGFEKWGLESLSKPKKTPVQESPDGFPHLKNTEVSVMKLTLSYPTTPPELAACIRDCISMPLNHIHVSNENDPNQIEPEADKKYEPVLTSPYPESSEEPKFGDKYNKQFIKELQTMPKIVNDDNKLVTTNDLPQGNVSPLGNHKVNLPKTGKIK